MSTKALAWIEDKGNKLPHPITLFAILSLFIILLSALLERMHVSVIVKKLISGSDVPVMVEETVNSLLSVDGVTFLLENIIHNFTNFAPLGVVLVSMLGISVASESGLLNCLIKVFLSKTSPKLVSGMIVFSGVMSNVASDAGYVIVIPLSALTFLSLGRHPLAGLAASFFGVSAGFSANLLLGSIDPLLAGFTTEGAKLLDPSYIVSAASNYYFMFASTFIIVIIGALITEKVVEPRLGEYTGHATSSRSNELTSEQQKGLKFAKYGFIALIALISVLAIPDSGILRNAETGSLLQNSPLINSIVIIISLFFFIPGILYGKGVGIINSDKDVVDMMISTMNKMGGYIVLTFFAAQFVAFFNYSNLGIISATKGADLLLSTGLSGIPLLVAFVFLVGCINLFVGSAVTKWSIMATIFVPMFMVLDISPELTQLAYRIGDSSTNIISPLMPFFAIVITIANDFHKNIGIGTLVSLMLPYSIAIFIIWTLFMILWLLLGIQVGPSVTGLI